MIDLTIKLTDMIVLTEPGKLQKIKKLYDGVLLYEYDCVDGYSYSSSYVNDGYVGVVI